MKFTPTASRRVLPLDVQMEMVRSIVGLEHAEIMRPGYAIEYDYFEPTQLYPTLETKLVRVSITPDRSTVQPDTKKRRRRELWPGSMRS